jgi:hypothetical protein
LWELSLPQDEQLLDHADQCSKCGTWLDKQRTLAATMQTLQAQTAGLQAGPHVERAVLKAFRQAPFEATQPVAALRFTPMALRLSRFFEVGAYAAVAAAIVVGLFLGVRLLEERRTHAARKSTPAATMPMLAPEAVAKATPQQPIASVAQEQPAAVTRRQIARHSVSRSVGARSTAAVFTASSDDADYVALMFCDPLICSTDAQVVRMELPAAGATDDRNAPAQLADVVVGYDGLVRAVRVVSGNLN